MLAPESRAEVPFHSVHCVDRSAGAAHTKGPILRACTRGDHDTYYRWPNSGYVCQPEFRHGRASRFERG